MMKFVLRWVAYTAGLTVILLVILQLTLIVELLVNAGLFTPGVITVLFLSIMGFGLAWVFHESEDTPPTITVDDNSLDLTEVEARWLEELGGKGWPW